MSLPTLPPERAEGCDAPAPAPVYVRGDGTYTCRCMVCGRCNHHTGNTSQGHYWAHCTVTKSNREFHFCCPGDCELEDHAMVDLRARFREWKSTLDDVTSWSHCGMMDAHGPHVEDVVFNEGVTPNCQCIGTPDLTQPTSPPPTLENM